MTHVSKNREQNVTPRKISTTKGEFQFPNVHRNAFIIEHPVFTEPFSLLSAVRQKEQQRIKGRFFQHRSTDPLIYIGGTCTRPKMR